MLKLLPSTKDYYDAWDIHMAEVLAAEYGYQGAVARCIEKKWEELEQILRSMSAEKEQSGPAEVTGAT